GARPNASSNREAPTGSDAKSERPAQTVSQLEVEAPVCTRCRWATSSRNGKRIRGAAQTNRVASTRETIPRDTDSSAGVEVGLRSYGWESWKWRNPPSAPKLRGYAQERPPRPGRSAAERLGVLRTDLPGRLDEGVPAGVRRLNRRLGRGARHLHRGHGLRGSSPRPAGRQ